MTRQRWIAPLLVAVSVVALLFSVAQGVERTRYERCQARVDDALIRAQQARAAAAEQRYAADDLSVRAEDDLWNAVNRNQKLPPDQAKARSEEAFQTYLQQRAQAQTMRDAAAADRKAHPLPGPPSERCG